MRTEYLLDREVDMILGAMTHGNALVLRVSLHTGLRIGDVLALRPEKLKPHFWVTEQKTGKRRQVVLPQPLLSKLQKHAGHFLVFPSPVDNRKHLTRQAVWKDVKRAARAFRLPQNVAPHSMRKVYVVELMKKYGDIKKVARSLNHSSESITLICAMADQLLEQKQARQRARAGRRRV